MNKKVHLLLAGLCVNAIALPSAFAGDPAKLGTELTPLGGEMAGNGDAIPAWKGGLVNTDHKPGERYVDPFSSDKPLYVIDKSNYEQYKTHLSAGQLALLERGDYRIPVYQTRRSAAAPEYIYAATKANAASAKLENDGESLFGAISGIPFPIPGSGKEVIWNHKLRYRGQSLVRYNNQAAVQQNGSYTIFKLKEDVKFAYSYPDITLESLGNVSTYFLQKTLEPARQAGGILLVHETIDQKKEPRRAWLYNPGQRRVRRAPNVAYDNPGTGADGLRTNDQLDAFNGATDRYTFTLKGKKEMIIPYNSYKLHSDKYKYADIIKPGAINQDLTRYEMHRVWVIEAELNEGTSHIYKKRVFFVDEDSWSIALVDIYDKRDQLWRFQEAHWAMAYDLPAVLPVLGTVYDLQANRYLTMDMSNEDPEATPDSFEDEYFNSSNMQKVSRKR